MLIRGMVRFLTRLLTLQLTSGEIVSRHVFMQTVDILKTFREQTLAINLHFLHVFLVQRLLSIVSARFFTVLVLGGRQTYLASLRSRKLVEGE